MAMKYDWKTIFSRGGPCLDSPRLVKLMSRGGRPAFLLSSLLRLRFSPSVLRNIRVACREDEEIGVLFSKAISLVSAGRTYKTTGAKRTRLADEAVFECAKDFNAPKVMEVGVSDGSSALHLLENGDGLGEVLLTDKHPKFHRLRGPWGEVFYDGNKMRIGCKAFGFYIPLSPMPGPEHGLEVIETRNPVLSESPEPREILPFDVFADVADVPVDIIKCSNVLNQSYFSREAIAGAVDNLGRSLGEGGYLVLSHNNERYTSGEAVAVLKKESGRFALVHDSGHHESLGLFNSLSVKGDERGDMPKLFILIPSLEPSGAERQAVMLANGLSRRGWQVVVAVFRGGGWLEESLDPEVSFYDLKKKGRWNLIGFGFRLIRLIRKERPEIFHPFLGIPCILSILVRMFIPRTSVVWSVRASNVDYASYGLVPRICYGVERFLSRFADAIIVNSEAGKRFAVSQGFPERKMTVVHNGVDTDAFRPDPGARERIRNELGLTNEVAVGVVARLDVMKGHAVLLEAADIVRERDGGVRFICVGDGPLSADLKREAAEASLPIDWLGRRSDMGELYNGFDMCCLCSNFGEGFPNVVGEAMACGVPCVVTDVGEATVLVEGNGEVVPAGNPDILAEAILRLVKKIRAGEVEDPRESIRKRFSIESLVEKTLAVFEPFAGGVVK